MVAQILRDREATDQGRLQPGWRILFLRGERHRRLRRVARAVMVNQ